jgi:hypothetical protein
MICLCVCFSCQGRGALRCLARDHEVNAALIAQSIENL